MAEEEKSISNFEEEKFWKDLIRKYWYFALIFGIIIVIAIASFFVVVWWYVNIRSAYTANGVNTLAEFSISTGILAFLSIILWIILFVALPALAALGLTFVIMWFVVFTEEEKQECKMRSKADEEKKKKRHKRGKDSGKGGGAFEFLVFIGVIIHLAVDGTLTTALGDPAMSIGYLTGVWIRVSWILMLILGIPAITFGILWFWKKFGTER
jgi:hypothetical protein